ncbi:MAG: DUF2786 domain-containing protein [Actinomycetota bacterium]
MTDHLETAPSADDTIIDRVRALMAKAEATPFPAEADAFMAKAQALIHQYAIDEARLHGTDPTSIGDERLPMAGSYSRERSHVWGAVAQANRCQVLTFSKPGSSAVLEICLIGRHRDRELVKVLATSLELQAMRRMGELDLDRSWETPVVQRRSFLRGFAGEVAHRLQRAKQEQQVFGSAAAALELAEAAVDDYLYDNFDVSTRRSQSRIDGAAYSRGRRAGATADVGSARLGRQRRELPS